MFLLLLVFTRGRLGRWPRLSRVALGLGALSGGVAAAVHGGSSATLRAPAPAARHCGVPVARANPGAGALPDAIAPGAIALGP